MNRPFITAALLFGASTTLKPAPPLAHALLAPVTLASRRKVRIRGWFDDLMGKRVEPPPQIQAFLAGASPQAKREYAALQDAFPIGASEDVQLEYTAFEQVFAGRQASG